MIESDLIKESNEITNLQKIIAKLLLDIEIEISSLRPLSEVLKPIELPKPELVDYINRNEVLLTLGSHAKLKEYVKAVILKIYGSTERVAYNNYEKYRKNIGIV